MTFEQTVAITEIMNIETVLSMRDAVALGNDGLVILDIGDDRTIDVDQQQHRALGPLQHHTSIRRTGR